MPETVLPTTALVLLCCAAALMGCATVAVVCIKDGVCDHKGLRYWLPAPYVIVKARAEVSYLQELAEVNDVGHVTVLDANPLNTSIDISEAAVAGMQTRASGVAKGTVTGNHPPKRLFLRTTTAVL